MFSKSKPITPWPFALYLSTLAILILVGLADSIYLSISHYRVYTDIEYKSFCALSKSFNCDTVSQSPFSIWAGVPVPVWGIMGYAFMLVMLPFGGSRDADRKRIWSLLFWISFIFVLFSVTLAFISTYFVGSYCIMCIVSYGVNLFLLLYCWMVNKRFSTSGVVKGLKKDVLFLKQKRRQSLPLLLVFLSAVTIIYLVFPPYWKIESSAASIALPTGITADGHPWIGAEEPQLEIIEFTDYQCFQCKKMHFFLRRLIAEHPEKIRLIHRNYPMDHTVNPIVKEPFHVGSGAMALMAISAERMDKFWPVNDYLFGIAGRTQVIDLKNMAEKVGLNYAELVEMMKARETQIELRRDIWKGNKMNIIGTPSYIIDGKIYQGQIPPEIIKKGLK